LKALSDCQPVDDPEVVFVQMKFLRPKVGDWKTAVRICREIAKHLSGKLIKE
jgi:hypothetical protein